MRPARLRKRARKHVDDDSCTTMALGVSQCEPGQALMEVVALFVEVGTLGAVRELIKVPIRRVLERLVGFYRET